MADGKQELECQPRLCGSTAHMFYCDYLAFLMGFWMDNLFVSIFLKSLLQLISSDAQANEYVSGSSGSLFFLQVGFRELDNCKIFGSSVKEELV